METLVCVYIQCRENYLRWNVKEIACFLIFISYFCLFVVVVDKLFVIYSIHEWMIIFPTGFVFIVLMIHMKKKLRRITVNGARN